MIFIYFLFISLLFTISQATSCGQPRRSASDKCSNWQCSRVIETPNNQSYFGYGMCVRGLPEGSECVVNDDCFINELTCEEDKTNPGRKVCVKKGSTKNIVIGYIGTLVAVLGYGTNFIPVKYVKHTSNGILFQFMMCCAIFIIGVITALAMKKYTFYPMGVLGGMIWCLGNLMCLPAIELIGMGLGVSTWGIMGMVIGFATGKWGLMGVRKETGGIEWAQYLGVIFALISILIISFISPTAKKQVSSSTEEPVEVVETFPIGDSFGNTPKMNQVGEMHDEGEPNQVNEPHIDNDNDGKSKGPKWLPPRRVLLGFGMAVIAGILFGMNFCLPQAQMNYYEDKTLEDPSSTPSLLISSNGLDYVLSYTTGIFFTSTFATLLFYGAHIYLPKSLVKYIPTIYDDMHLVDFPTLIVPAFICGALWGIACVGWFVANTNVGLSVSYPIISIGPMAIANIFGIFLFKEIQGKRNFILLGATYLAVFISIFFTVYSKH